MTKVKICGLQEPEHVRAAVEAGADAIGFVFAKSKRQVSVAQAQQLAQHIPHNVLTVGVFVDETVEVMQQIAKTVPLDVIQLHGHETNAVIQQLIYPTIKAVGVQTAADVEALQTFESDYVLVDAPVAGSGETFDWDLLTTRYPQLILAGGLSRDNVTEALTRVAPYMVDVSSGVETNGVKDTAKISAFITAVKNGENA